MSGSYENRVETSHVCITCYYFDHLEYGTPFCLSAFEMTDPNKTCGEWLKISEINKGRERNEFIKK